MKNTEILYYRKRFCRNFTNKLNNVLVIFYTENLKDNNTLPLNDSRFSNTKVADCLFNRVVTAPIIG